MRCQLSLLALVFTTFGCRISPTFEAAPTPDGGTVAGGSTAGGSANDDFTSGRGGSAAAGTTGGSVSAGGRDSPSRGGTSSDGDAPGGTSATPPGGAAGEAGGGISGGPDARGAEPSPVPKLCDAQSVTFEELRAGEVRDDVKVRIDAVATSQKFLVSHAQSGSCLFGAFVGTDPDSGGPHGLLLVAYGDDAPESEPCVPGHDALPDDLTPGDFVTGIGYLNAYAPSTCDAAVPSPQLVLASECSLARAGRRMLPAPYDLSPDDATALASGTDAPLVRRFAGGLVRLANLHTLRPAEGVGSVGAYGVVRFAETALELHNDLEYGDLTLGGPGDAQKSLSIPYPASFDAVTGLVYLDYCTWAVTPRSRCGDLEPPSEGCS